MLKINPLTAWRMLHDFVRLEAGDWVIQNAANSAAGRAVIQISRELGYRTVNVVRRAELIEELRAEGGDVVLLDDDNLREAAAAATENAPIRLALNAVGGESALRLAKIVAPEATIVTYGAMSLQPLRLPNGLLIFKNLHFTGFWVNKWYEQATPAARQEAFDRIFSFAQRGLLQTKIERTYPLADFAAAVARAGARSPRRKSHLPDVDASLWEPREVRPRSPRRHLQSAFAERSSTTICRGAHKRRSLAHETSRACPQLVVHLVRQPQPFLPRIGRRSG